MSEFRNPEPDSEVSEDSSYSSNNEMSIDELLQVFTGMMEIVALKLKSSNLPLVQTELENFYGSQRYTELASFLRVLQCHFQMSDPNLKEAFAQMSDTITPVIDDLGLKSDPLFLKKSLLGVFTYFKLCFKDNKLNNSSELQDSFFEKFTLALENEQYHKLYGMLIVCQELFHEPDKDIIYDIIHEHLIGLCPDLE